MEGKGSHSAGRVMDLRLGRGEGRVSIRLPTVVSAALCH